jgi:hypothetical protein
MKIKNTKRAKKLWDRLVKQSKENIEASKQIYKDCCSGIYEYDNPCAYVADGIYVTKCGVFLSEEERSILFY